MKKFILKTILTLVLVTLFTAKINAQSGGGGVVCPPGSCPPCWSITYDDRRPANNPSTCLLSFWWRYPGSPNCGDVLSLAVQGNFIQPTQAYCMKCCTTDNNCGPCQCPTNLLLYIGNNQLAFVGPLNFGTVPPSGYPYTVTQSFGTPNCSFSIVVQVTGPNQATIIIQ